MAQALDPRVEQAGLVKEVTQDQVIDPDAKFAFQQTFKELPGLTIGSRPGHLPRVMMFSLTNDGSEKVNPKGLTRKDAHRRWNFQFVDQARESLYMVVRDQPFSGRDSHTNMQTEIHLFPRKYIPSVKDLGEHYQVVLSTGEQMLFDKNSREVISGPFKESPIDYDQDRFKRKNPLIHYEGEGLMIKISQRGENPRYEEVWGQKKMATVSFPSKYSKPCQLRPSLLWDHRKIKGEDTPSLMPLYKTDEDLYKIVERECKWDLKSLTEKSQTLSDADCVHCGPITTEPVVEQADPLEALMREIQMQELIKELESR